MKHLLYYLFFFFWFVASLLPLRLLYFFSDLLYYPLFFVVRYRRKVVRKNLEESFPEKSLVELRKIEREFYHYFCDYIVETIKLFSMSEKQMRQRMTFGGVDKINEIIKHKDCVLYLGHYCNWEWVSSIPLHLGMTDNFIAGQIYHQIENKAFDKLFLWMRSRFHAVNIEMLMALRHLVRYKQQNKRFIIGFISDQSPNWNFVKMWTEFLNHKSSFFIGAESIAKATDAAVVYLDVQRVKRGYYHADFVVMTEDPKSFPDYEITVDYARRLEETIRRAPQYWHRSHNRWKLTYEKYLKLKSESA